MGRSKYWLLIHEGVRRTGVLSPPRRGSTGHRSCVWAKACVAACAKLAGRVPRMNLGLRNPQLGASTSMKIWGPPCRRPLLAIAHRYHGLVAWMFLVIGPYSSLRFTNNTVKQVSYLCASTA